MREVGFLRFILFYIYTAVHVCIQNFCVFSHLIFMLFFQYTLQYRTVLNALLSNAVHCNLRSISGTQPSRQSVDE